MINISMIKEHYRFLKHIKQTEIRLFGKDVNSNRIFIVNNEDDFISKVINLKEYNIGVGVNERGNGGIEDKDVTNMNYIVIDIDSKEKDIIEDTENKLKENNLKYSAKVFTGNKGYHYYFPIKPLDDKQKIKNILDNCKHYFIHDLKIPVDPLCFNPSRVFRIWGSLNKNNLVEVLFLNKDVPLIDAEKIIPNKPESEISTLINSDKHVHSVVDDFPLFEAIRKNPSIFPIKENTNFNDVIVKNIAAYIQCKNITDLEPFYKLLKLKNHPIVNLDNWLKKSRFFNPFEVMGNIRKHYPDTLYKNYCIGMRQIPMHSITYINDDEMKWKQLKENNRETNSFIVNSQYKSEGSLVILQDEKMVWQLAKVYVGIEDPNFYYKIYLDEPNFKKGLTRNQMEDLGVRYKGEINASVYIYQYKTINNEIITVLSEEKIQNGRYKLRGTLMKFDDKFNIGQSSYRDIYTYTLMLHSYEFKEIKYKKLSELYEDFKVSGDDYYQYLMTEIDNTSVPMHYITSDFYKKIYTAFLFSGSMDKGQKLNIIIFGPSGTGKTPQLRAISEKFTERKFYTGTSLTIPGLTISHYSTPYKPGALLECIRVCAIDEFFKIFNKLDDVSKITDCNDYLDNQIVSAGSGKQEVQVQSTCQVIGVTNPIRRNNKAMGIRKKMTLFEMFDYVDADFWGRFIVINQTDEDREWILNPDNLQRNVVVKDVNREKFTAVYDFYKSVNVSGIDRNRINKIVRKIQVPESIEDVYKKMCLRGSYLLFDGMVKWRCFNQKVALKPEERDYLDFELLWKEIIARLFIGESDQPLDLIFSESEQDIISLIKEKNKLTYEEFKIICEARGIEYSSCKKRMVEAKVIKLETDKRWIVYNKDLDALEELNKNDMAIDL